MLENTEGAIEKVQSGERYAKTGNCWYESSF